VPTAAGREGVDVGASEGVRGEDVSAIAGYLYLFSVATGDIQLAFLARFSQSFTPPLPPPRRYPSNIAPPHSHTFREDFFATHPPTSALFLPRPPPPLPLTRRLRVPKEDHAQHVRIAGVVCVDFSVSGGGGKVEDGVGDAGMWYPPTSAERSPIYTAPLFDTGIQLTDSCRYLLLSVDVAG